MNIVLLDAASLGTNLDFTPFNQFGDVTIYQKTTKSELKEHGEKADVLIINKFEIGLEELMLLPKLKLICLTATGYNNIDIIKAKEYGVIVTNVAGYSTESVAQHTFSMLLYQMQHLKYYDNYVRTGIYPDSETFTNIEKSWNEISGKKWGIIGLGNIGRRVASIATSFGAEVYFTSTSGIKRDEIYKELPFQELISNSDIISIHAPLNNNTLDLISFKEFEEVKPNLFILNLGRGGIINEEALANAIDSDKIKGACIDVLTSEPVNADNPLINIKKKDKILITPHIAWASIEARNKVIQEICLNIDSYNNGEKRNQVIS